MSASRKRPALRTLADRAGILPSYVDVRGKRRLTSNPAREAVLTALGFDVSNERSAADALRLLDERDAARLIQPIASARFGDPQRLEIRLPRGWGGARYDLEITDESGRERRQVGALQGARRSRAWTALPRRLPAGYYRLRIAVSARHGLREGEQLVIVSPPRCTLPRERLGRPRGFGVMVNLYTVRSGRNWGAGDLTDLARLAQWAGRMGGQFLALNPLHALLHEVGGVSPYDPVSRLFRNPLYLDPEAAVEFRESPEARALTCSPEYESALRGLRDASHIDYARIMRLKRPVFAELHRRFAAAPQGSARHHAFQRYAERQGKPLVDFATFLALASRYSPEWRRWPADLARPDAPGVRGFQNANASEIDLHRYVQFELDTQLAAAAGSARRAGLAIGLLGDLAIGVGANSSDTWAFPDLFVDGAHIGAPPDEYSPAGQDWGLAPLHPLRLVERGCDYWIGLVRQAMEHMGALRIDHVMGLFRQYWVPVGAGPEHGAYIRYPAEHLLGVLALESARHQAIVVGEDLGTVPKGLPAVLERWGIQSTRLLYFEREKNGAFRPAAKYSPRAVVSINTHDHPPFAGFWSGRDLELRYQAGVIRSDRELAAARAERAAARAALLRRLRADRVLAGPPGAEPPSIDRLCGTVHAFLARTPSPLLSVAMDDLLGETEPVNLPGVPPDKYPSWTRRACLPLESLDQDPAVQHALGDMRRRTGKSR